MLSKMRKPTTPLAFIEVLIVATILCLVCAVLAISAGATRTQNGENSQAVQGYAFESNVDDALQISRFIEQLEKLVSVDSTPESTYLPLAKSIIEEGFGLLPTGSVGERVFDTFAAFWENQGFARSIVSNVITANTTFEAIKGKALARVRGAIEAVRYHVLMHSIIHEIEAAVSACDKSPSQARSSLDRAAALYLGTGVDTERSKVNVGKMLFKLSNELCQTSRTCISEDGMYGDSTNNKDIIAALNEGADHISKRECAGLSQVRARLFRLLLVPSLQYLIKQSFKLDPKQNDFGNVEEKTKAHVHALALLPVLSICDNAAAKTLALNFQVGTSPYLPLGYLATADLIASFLPCLNLNCDMLGGYTSYYVAEIEKCIDDPEESDLPPRKNGVLSSAKVYAEMA